MRQLKLLSYVYCLYEENEQLLSTKTERLTCFCPKVTKFPHDQLIFCSALFNLCKQWCTNDYSPLLERLFLGSECLPGSQSRLQEVGLSQKILQHIQHVNKQEVLSLLVSFRGAGRCFLTFAKLFPVFVQ